MLMSFEFFSGIVGLGFLKQMGAPAPQAECVAEAIIRHQGPVQVGTIHTVGSLIQIATLFGASRLYGIRGLLNADLDLDNLGAHKVYVHADTVEDVNKHYPRRQWSRYFSSKQREEITLKPWCHSTAVGPSFPDDVEHNALMEPYDGRF